MTSETDLLACYFDLLHSHLHCRAHPFIKGALLGNVADSVALIENSPNQLVHILRVFYGLFERVEFRDRTQKAFQAAFKLCWSEDHLLLEGISDQEKKRIIRAAGSPYLGRSEVLVVYRGGRGSMNDLCKGWSWSTDRDVACWFAYYCQRNRDRDPLLIKGSVGKKDIFHFDTDGLESELIIFGIKDVIVDGESENWQKSARRHHEKKYNSEIE